MWVAFSTAYGALVETARMRPGDRVLISAASGAVGRAAIQIANHIGAVPIAVTRRAAKRDELLAFGAAEVIATDEQDVVASGPPADIVLDLVMGPGQQALVDAARPGATLVTAGFLDPRPTPFPRGAGLEIHPYRSFEHTLDPAAVRRMAAFLEAGVRLGALRPRIDAVFAFDDVVAAHRRVEEGRHDGKVVVVASRSEP